MTEQESTSRRSLDDGWTGTREPTKDRVVPRWFDGAIPHPGSRLLSSQWLTIFVWLSGLVALAVNAATMPTLYRAFVPLTLVASMLHAVSLPVALKRPKVAVALSTIALGGTTVLTMGREVFPWPIPVVSLVITSLLCAILALRERWPYAMVGSLLAVVVPGLCATVVALLRDEWRPILPNLLTAASVLALVTTFGVLIRESLMSRAELLAQQERTAAEQERRQLVEERTRIARELHDIVAHSLSIISIQASTLRYRVEGVTEEVRTELDQITESARTALVEMRDLLAVLRQEDAEQELAPQPTLSRIPELIGNVRRSAAVVSLEVQGDLDDEAVLDVTGISAYRIVQEALSNAVRHAPGAPVDVRIELGQDVLVIDVRNPGSVVQGSRPGATTPSSPAPVDQRGDGSADVRAGGFGLRGMRERATFAGGRLHAGPLSDGGFSVHAELPLHGAGAPGGFEGQSPPA
ncbi:sensor histidine kinase [Pseudactinotalea sp. Z1748]|uniref:sensor histidine kinase n=1 Tax=Pseudactinotalea sp. Z1748 TaxID=3413027 RepID=UPI003C7AB713